MGAVATFFGSLLGGFGRRSIENPSTPLSAPDDWLYGALGAVRSSAGINVNRETALTYAAVWRATSLLSRDVGKLPFRVYRRAGAGKDRDTNHPASRLLRRKPNECMTAFIFRQLLMVHALLQGNGYAYIVRNGAGEPISLVPLFPDRTYPLRQNNVTMYATEIVLDQGDRMELRKLPAEDVLHIKGLGYDGLQGYSVISKARESLGLGMAAQKFGSIFFRNNARPNLALEYPGRLSEMAVKNIRESWERAHSGLDQSHRVALFQEGVKLHQFSINARDSQLLETRAFEIREVANWFNIPPHKLGDTSRTSYNSLEQENQAYLDEALDPWLCNWEEECDDKLLTEEQKDRDSHCCKYQRSALVRANLDARGNYYQKALQSGWLNRDEVRAEEDLNPIPDGEGARYFLPLNLGMTPKLDEEDEEELTPAEAQDLRPGDELLDVPDIRQADNYSCGAACAMAVGKYFGVGPDELEEWKKELGTTEKDSTRPMAIVEYLTSLGLAVQAAGDMTLEDLTNFWREGVPIICPIQEYGVPSKQASFNYGHYVVVIGVGLGQVFVQDPSIDNALGKAGGDVPLSTPDMGTDAAPGRMLIDQETWLKVWHDSDADGRQYVQFGIAVSDAVIGGVKEEEEEEGGGEQDPPGPGNKTEPQLGGDGKPTVQPDPTAPAQTDQPRAASLTIAHTVLCDAVRRMVRRIGIQAQRAAQDPRKFMAWLDTYRPENLTVVSEALAPAEQACDAATGIPLTGVIRNWLLEQLHAELTALADRATARNLASETAALAGDLETRIPAAAVARFLEATNGT
jgi:HK97 family phage portal protein